MTVDFVFVVSLSLTALVCMITSCGTVLEDGRYPRFEFGLLIHWSSEIVQRNRHWFACALVSCTPYHNVLQSILHSSLCLCCPNPRRGIPARFASWDPCIHLTYCDELVATPGHSPATTMSSLSSPSAAAASYEQNGAQDEPTALARLLEVAAAILRQGVDLVENGLTSDEHLTAHSNYIPGSTIGTSSHVVDPSTEKIDSIIGKHLRHARDHFVLLLDANASSPPHVLSYDKRLRNTPMESSRTAARDALNECITNLQEAVPKARIAEPITLHAVTPYPQVMETTFGREVRTLPSLHGLHMTLDRSYGLLPYTLSTTGVWLVTKLCLASRIPLICYLLGPRDCRRASESSPVSLPYFMLKRSCRVYKWETPSDLPHRR